MIRTERLVLRQWRPEDLEPFARMNADPKVMEHFLAPLSREKSDLLVTNQAELIEKRGWGIWAVSVVGEADFIGFIGLAQVDFVAPFVPAVEVGWRLAYEYWGRGYAPEGAKAALQFGFEQLGLDEIVSFTATSNLRSMRVMEKLHMHRTVEDDFDHPRIPEGHPIRRHVFYRLTSSEWLALK